MGDAPLLGVRHVQMLPIKRVGARCIGSSSLFAAGGPCSCGRGPPQPHVLCGSVNVFACRARCLPTHTVMCRVFSCVPRRVVGLGVISSCVVCGPRAPSIWISDDRMGVRGWR